MSQSCLAVALGAPDEQLDAERDEREGPVFEVGDQLGKPGPALASLNGDTAAVPVTLVAGPDLERVNITARGPVRGIIALHCNLDGSSIHWNRPELHSSITVQLFGTDPTHDSHSTLVLECYEKPPGAALGGAGTE